MNDAVLAADPGATASSRAVRAIRRVPLRAGWREVALLALLYLGYSLTRSLADGSFHEAARLAHRLWSVESDLGLAVEASVNRTFASTPWLALASSYWYASLHFVVTGGTLLWVFLRRRAAYPAVRNALVVATMIALVLYLLMPMAPPRLLGGPFHDVLAETSASGWWPAAGGHGAAPTGLANELAAFPSMHAGWALWVALTLWRCAPRRAGAAGVLYAAGTAVVVVGTGNHWVLDVVAGWVIVLASWWVVRTRREHTTRRAQVLAA